MLYFWSMLASLLFGAITWAILLLSNQDILADLLALSGGIVTIGLFFTWHGYLYDQDEDKFVLGLTAMILVFAVGIWVLVNIYTGDIYHIDLVNKIICHFTCPQ